MRNAETVLGIIHERGEQGLPLEDIYRQLYNPHLYLRAYERLRINKGALTPGTTGETVDGMSMEKIGRIIDAVRDERYRWTPTKRVYIPKRNGKRRPLGLPTWSDKLLQEVMRSILEAYYEPQFSDHSHGFRPNRGCHTALTKVAQTWKGTKWFIEGDIAQCFDRLDHDVLLGILATKLRDNRFMRLIATMLKAGYSEQWRWNATFSGTPQGGVISPILSNIYLDQLDQFVENELLTTYNRGLERRRNPDYRRIEGAIERARKAGNREQMHELLKQRRMIPYGLPNDPDFRRLKYVRYADDFLLGYNGPKAEAEEIKVKLREYLQDKLKLELSEDKTLITHAGTTPARFLGYHIVTQHANDKVDQRGHRCVNETVGLRAPADVIEDACAKYTRNGKPIHRAELRNASDYSIVRLYQAEYRGLVQYYLLAANVTNLHRLHYVMAASLLKTLAGKHKTKVTAIVSKYKATVETPYGRLKCLRVTVNRGEDRPPLIAQFGGIPLRRQPRAQIIDKPMTINTQRTDLLKRMLADVCELCGDKGDCQVHHIRKLADLHVPGRRDKPAWVKRMIAMRRKTLVVCRACHVAIHTGKPTRQPVETVTGEPDDLKGSRPVREEANGKVPTG